MSNVHLYDWRWIDEEQWVLRGLVGSQRGHRILQWGNPLSLKVLSDVFCHGAVRENQYFPCPDQVQGRAFCSFCRSRAGGTIFTAFDGFNRYPFSDHELQQLQGEHLVYLAWFGSDMIKVGVSRQNRETLRQLEQGSHATLFIARTPDGILVRQIETLVARTGLRDKCFSKQKKNTLVPLESLSEIRSQLESVAQICFEGLKGYPNLQAYWHDQPRFRSWEQVYHLSELSHHKWETISLERGEGVSGTIVMVKGGLIGLKIRDEMVVLSVSELVGRHLDFSPQPTGMIRNQSSQSQLF